MILKVKEGFLSIQENKAVIKEFSSRCNLDIQYIDEKHFKLKINNLYINRNLELITDFGGTFYIYDYNLKCDNDIIIEDILNVFSELEMISMFTFLV